MVSGTVNMVITGSRIYKLGSEVIRIIITISSPNADSIITISTIDIIKSISAINSIVSSSSIKGVITASSFYGVITVTTLNLVFAIISI